MEKYTVKKEHIQAQFADMADFRTREISLGARRFCLFFIGNHASKKNIDKMILSPLIRAWEEGEDNFRPEDRITCPSVSPMQSEEDAIQAILGGNCLLLCSDCAENQWGLSVGVRNEEGRSEEEPETENVIRGPHEGFVESAEQNAMLLRRRIKSTALKKIDLTIGTLTQTAVSVIYMEGTADADMVNTLIKRLQNIRINGILDSGYAEMYIQDGKYALFPGVGNSERPDKVASKLLEGRAAVIVDGSPVVLTVPYLFCEAIQVTEDYSKSTWYATFMRLLRFISLLIGLYLPALFAALAVRHPSLLSASFLDIITKSRENLHFSILTEIILVFCLFEIVREVGLRMPKAVGSAVGLVGSLILGDSAVKAGIASPTVMVFVALAAICNFISPPYMNAGVIYRFLMIAVSGLFGLFGFFVGFSATVFLLCTKTSFGVPYLYPLAPMDFYGLSDYILMLPIWKMKRVPSGLVKKPLVRAWKRRDAH